MLSAPPSRGRRRVVAPARTRTAYNPIGFDPEAVLPERLRRHGDYARYFLHVLYAQRVFKDIDDEYVPLKASYLRRFFPDNDTYKEIRDRLIDTGTVLCDGVYRQADGPNWKNSDPRHRNGKCYGYRLGPRWEGVRHERLQLSARALLKSIEKVRQDRCSEIATPAHRHIWGCLRQVTIDFPAAEAELDDLMDGATPEQIDGYTGQRMLCEGIRDGDWQWHVCEFGRVYNNLTGLKRSLRSHLRVDGEPLVSCDVRNSQPLLVGLLCKLIIQRGKEGIPNNNSLGRPHLSPSFSNIEIDQQFLDSLSRQEAGGGERGARGIQYDVVFDNPSFLDNAPEDLRVYVRLCEEGRLYDDLMADSGDEIDRDAFKKRLFTQVFYGRNFVEGGLTKLFAERFPTVWAVVRSIKRPDYRRLSHHMLRAESAIVIGRAVRRCAEKGIWAATIHDSIVTTPEHAESVVGIMEEAFGSVGVRPTIKVTAFDEEAQDALGGVTHDRTAPSSSRDFETLIGAACDR
mgnify:CR=1 FL=1